MSILADGQVIRDTYEVERFLGEGAFAEVYRVRHRFLGRQAMKVFKRVGMDRNDIDQRHHSCCLRGAVDVQSFVDLVGRRTARSTTTFPHNSRSGCCEVGLPVTLTLYDRGGRKRVTTFRGTEKVLTDCMMKAAAFNLGLVLRVRFGAGAPKAMANTLKEAINGLYRVEKCLLRRLSFLLRAFLMWQKQNQELGAVPPGQNLQAAA